MWSAIPWCNGWSRPMRNAMKTEHNGTTAMPNGTSKVVHREIRTHTPSTVKESLPGWEESIPW